MLLRVGKIGVGVGRLKTSQNQQIEVNGVRWETRTRRVRVGHLLRWCERCSLRVRELSILPRRWRMVLQLST